MKISNNLVAYAMIASKIEENENIFSAFAPFFLEILRNKQTKTFFPKVISNGMSELYGIIIPELAVEGMISSLLDIGFLQKKSLGRNARYELKPEYADAELPSSSETKEINETVERIFKFVTNNLNSKKFKEFHDDYVKNVILDTLIQPKIWRGNRKTEKEFDNDIPLKHDLIDEAIEFHSLEYVLHAHDNEPDEFDRLSKIATSGLAISFLSAFNEPQRKQTNIKPFSF